jgi:hypothetical protein
MGTAMAVAANGQLSMSRILIIKPAMQKMTGRKLRMERWCRRLGETAY